MAFVHNWRKGRADYARLRLGNATLKATADKLIKLLTEGGFKFSIAGGYAVQHHGYPRFTEDVDIIVQDIDKVRDYLRIRGFKAAPGARTIMYDRATKVEINLLPSGVKLTPKSDPIPEPDEEVLSLAQLLNNKLSSYKSSPMRRARDLGDVTELIQRNALPRDFPVTDIAFYQQIWDDLQNEVQPDNPT